LLAFRHGHAGAACRHGEAARGAPLMARVYRVLIVLAGLMGAGGVVLAAGAAHLPDATRLGAASSKLVFHATAGLGAVARFARGIVRRRIGAMACFGFVAAASLFAGDLTMRRYAGQGLFPMAAPTGGTLLIASWLLLALSAAWPGKASGKT